MTLWNTKVEKGKMFFTLCSSFQCKQAFHSDPTNHSQVFHWWYSHETHHFQNKWSDVWPSMVTHTLNLCFAFNPSKCTHTAVNTHTPWTHTQSQCCGAWGAVGGSVSCSRAHQLWYWWWILKVSANDNSCQTWDPNPRPIRPRSPTLY